MKKTVLLISICILILSGIAASAEGPVSETSQVIKTISTAEIHKIVNDLKYENISVDEDGDLIFEVNGIRAMLIRIREGQTLLIRASWSGSEADLETVNEWNRDKLYCRAFIDSAGDPVIEMDLDLEGGVTVARVEDFIRTSAMLLTAFAKEVLQ